MPCYHLSCKVVSRSRGRSAVASAAYRSASRLRDERTDQIHDYTHKTGVVESEIWALKGVQEWVWDRERLWNAAEAAEKRRDATVAREFEIALPEELTHEQQLALVRQFSRELVERHHLALEFSIHEPSAEGDQRNRHAHVLCTTRQVGPEGFGRKTRELDVRQRGEVQYWRERWGQLQNEYLRAYGHQVEVDHRTLEAQGIERQPQRHKGPVISALERQGRQSEVLERWAVEAVERQQETDQRMARQLQERRAIQQKREDAQRQLQVAEGELQQWQLAMAQPDREADLESQAVKRWLAYRKQHQHEIENKDEDAAVKRWLAYRKRQLQEQERTKEKQEPQHRGPELEGPELF